MTSVSPGRHPIFTAEHEELRDSVRRFVDKELRPYVEEWEDAAFFPDDVFRRAGELGFLGLHYPERWGGAGGDLAAEVVFGLLSDSLTLLADAGRTLGSLAAPRHEDLIREQQLEVVAGC